MTLTRDERIPFDEQAVGIGSEDQAIAITVSQEDTKIPDSDDIQSIRQQQSDNEVV